MASSGRTAADAWAEPALSSAEAGSRGLSIAVLGGFQLLLDGARVTLPGGSERLLAYLALADRSAKRLVIATVLWPDASESHAYGNLRSALSRLGLLGRTTVRVGGLELALREDVQVDVHDARTLAYGLVDPARHPTERDLSADTVAVLSRELLPGWYDDWALVEAEDWRQLRLHALEALAGHLCEVARFAGAIGAARAAVRAEPLRESARAVLIRVHLAEGNRTEALREFARFRDLLQIELGLEPTPSLRRLVEA